MEDRHSLSEPRAIKGLALPTWEVDVYREGVDTPIMTIVLDNKTLPPRRRKKKIVWKLPDSIEHTPKFGVEDKKRILEIFKEKKKELKKQRKSLVNSGSGSFDETAEQAVVAADNPVVPPLPPGIAPISNSPPVLLDKTGGGDGSSSRGADTEAQPKPPPKQPPGLVKRTTSKVSDTDKETTTTTNGSIQPPKPPVSSPPPGFHPPPAKKQSKPAAEQYRRKKTQPSPPGSSPLGSRATALPPRYSDPETEGISKSPVSPPKPAAKSSAANGVQPQPGESQKAQEQQQQSSSSMGGPPGAPPQRNPNHHPHQHPTQQEPPGLSNGHPPSNLAGGSSGDASPPLLLAQGARQFSVPPNSNLAQIAAESYYQLLANGMIEILASHYCHTAQKSCTVGGAHAVCQSPEDRERQLRSLVGIVVQIKGLLQQPTAGHGTLVLITGTCIKPHALPFCHSLVLIPTSTYDPTTGGGGYQIQNDALCFLSSA